MFEPIPDHVEAALKRLITQYRGATNLNYLLQAIIQPLNDVESALSDMNTLRYLPAAFGAQLDLIGKIVGLSRPPGMGDAQYLLELYGQIKINTSEGQPEQAIQVFQLFTGADQVRLFEFFPARVQIQSSYVPPDQATTDTIINAVNNTLPAGIATEGFVSYDPVSPFGYAGVLSPSGGYTSGKYASLNRHKFPFGYAGANKTIKGYGSAKDPLVGGVYAG